MRTLVSYLSRTRYGLRCAHWPLAVLLVVIAVHGRATAQLRIATYNTLDKPFDTAADGQFTTIMDAVGTTAANGLAKRVDILALQEQTNLIGNNTAARMAGLLNTLYGVNSYQPLVIGGGTDKVAYVYDESTVQWIGSLPFAIGTRPVHRVQFCPVGYTSEDADLYLYNVHLNATSATTRASEINNLLTNSESLAANLNSAGNESNFIYLGDFNFSNYVEEGFVNLTSPGPAQGIDPVDSDPWPFPSESVSKYLSQSTRTASLGDGGAPGGINDRFDQQIVTADLMDGAGLSYIGPTVPGAESLDHSYQAFGNDGTSYNLPITLPISTQVAPRSQPANVLQALHNFSDHLPVVADYQVPAILSAVLGSVPETVHRDEVVDIEVTVENIAAAAAAVGADELVYSLTASGDLNGTAEGVAPALGGGNYHSILLDTSTVGLKSGMITVSTGSKAAENPLIMLPVEFEVISRFPPGDYNESGKTDAADYTIYRNTLGSTEDLRADGSGPQGIPDGIVDEWDYQFWKDHYGATMEESGSSDSVPEPTALTGWIIALICVLVSHRFRARPSARRASVGVLACGGYGV